MYVLEEVSGDFDEVEIGRLFDGKFLKKIGKAASGVGKVAAGVAKSKIFQGVVGVVAVAFPAVGIPAAAALAAANIALKKVEAGANAAAEVNAKLKELKAKASTGNTEAAHAVNAMQVVLAARQAKKMGIARVRPVAVPGKGSFSIKPVAQASEDVTTVGKRARAAVKAGKSVAVPDAVAVVPGQRPTRHKKVWIGRPPRGVKARKLAGAHVVTRGGYILSGQSVFAA
jgi:hypothetical protein